MVYPNQYSDDNYGAQQSDDSSSELSATDIHELTDAVHALNENMHKLIRLFQNAEEDIVTNYNQQRNEMSRKLDEVANQNQKIAEGILAIADQAGDDTSSSSDSSVPNFSSPPPEFSDTTQPLPEPEGFDQPNPYAQDQSLPEPQFEQLPQQDMNAQYMQDQQQMDDPFASPPPAGPLPDQGPRMQQMRPPQQTMQQQPFADEPIQPNFPRVDPNEFRRPTPPQPKDLPNIPLPPERKGFLSKFKK